MENVEKVESNNREILLGRTLKNNQIVDPVDKFFVDVPIIYGVYKTKEVPEEKINYKIRWTCIEGWKDKETKEDVPNHMILEMPKEYDPKADQKAQEVDKKQDFMIMFDLRKKSVLPFGKYKVEVFIKDELVLGKEFTLEERKGLFLGKQMSKFGIEDYSTSFDGHVIVIFGIYHFGQMQKSEKKGDPLGSIVWSKLDDEGKEVKELQKTPINASSDGQGYDCFKFHISKPPKGFETGKYKVSVFNGKKVLIEAKEFTVVAPKPKLFLGTVITKYGDIVDDKEIFPGNVKILRGVYKFCKVISKDKVGKIMWTLETAPGLSKPSKIGESKIQGKKDFDYFSFQMDFSKAPQTIPGRYKCEVFLENEKLAERYFSITPTYKIELGKLVKGKIEKPTNFFPKGIKEVSGMLSTNYVFPENTHVAVFWFASEAMGFEKNKLIFQSNKRMEKKFRNIQIFCKLKQPFPEGKYSIVIAINGRIVSAQAFQVKDINALLPLLNKQMKNPQQFMKNIPKPTNNKDDLYDI